MKDTASDVDSRFEKPAYDSVSKIISTDLGWLHIRGPVSAGTLSDYHFSEGLSCFRPPKRQQQALIEHSKEPDGIVFTAALANNIITYVSFQKPDFPWWIKRCFPRLLELGSVETDLSWRKMGLSKTLFDTIFKDPDFKYFEDFITIAVHTIYSWDLKNTCLSPWDYRKYMLKLFGQYGFVPWETEDPEIREHPCNILLARIGTNLEQKDVRHFANCCLGVN